MADDWIQKAIERPGAFSKKAKERGLTTAQFADKVEANPEHYSERTEKQANLAETLRKVRKYKGKKK